MKVARLSDLRTSQLYHHHPTPQDRHLVLISVRGIAIVNKEMYIDMLRRLWDAVRRKRPEKRRTSSWFLLHDNAPAHRAVGEDFLAKNNVTTLEHPPYSPNMTAADFYLLPRLISSLKGRRFCDATDIKNAT
jgi:hypothetical protein